MKIQKIDTNFEINNMYILLNDSIIVQLDKESNRLHADYNTYSICIDNNACEANENLNDEEKQEILQELKKDYSQIVQEFENFIK